MNISAPSAQTILDHAIQLALREGWEDFSLVELAKLANCPLTGIKMHFRSKDDLAEALFDRADLAMLQLAEDETFHAQNLQQRTINCIMCWFNFFTPIKPLVKDIMLYKLEPGHFHLQAHGVTRVSRTVQWFREVSGRPHQGFSKVADEIALTSAYLASFSFYLIDESKDNANTRALLNGLVKRIHRTQDFLSMKFSLAKTNNPLSKKE
ncbi:MAG: TetR/AcrR family transcriptional regulator [Kangiellaceae bacterium]|nr:TetR/AcrR family transcriptional regulator [Kangiellaceae bacterium]MCW8998306.1 TetR/AcrR family transcriptional regulator [Kangiellaceae bacterium]MCW9017488.1 TetR/AcrR family transcriptional regulator [Kangiellaceae bacterium]